MAVKSSLIVLVIFLCNFEAVYSEEECGLLKSENPPWNVGVYRQTRNNNLELICLGTVIRRNAILTAAHCLCDESGKLRREEFFISSKILDRHTKENRNLEKVDKRSIFIHDAFKGGLRKNDLAILGLQGSSKNEFGAPICIDWENTRPILEDGEKLRHISWQNGNLKMLDVSYVDFDHCQYLASNSFKSLLTSDKICAKSGREFMGDIDDGSGLMYFNFIDNLWYIRGVVSTHDSEKHNLISYSNIVLYLNWLSNVSVRL